MEEDIGVSTLLLEDRGGDELFILEYCLGSERSEILVYQDAVNKNKICKIMNSLLEPVKNTSEIKKEFGFQDPKNEKTIYLLRVPKEDKTLQVKDLNTKF